MDRGTAAGTRDRPSVAPGDVAHAPSAAVRAWVPLVAWCALVGAAALLVQRLREQGLDVKLDAPPLHASAEPGFTPLLVLALAAGIVAVRWLPVVAARARWRDVLVAAYVASAVLAVALALVHRGGDGITEPLLGRYEYLEYVDEVGAPLPFLDGFADAVRAREYSVHVHGHPPLFLLGLFALDEVGLGGAGPAAALIIAVGALMAPAVLVATRDVVGEDLARRAMPFTVIAPTLVWVATSADAVFAGVGAVAVALVVRAICDRGPRADLAAVAGGVAFGIGANLSYGLPLLAAVPVVVGLVRRRLRPLVLAAAGGAAVLLGFLVAGFWWLDGLAATRERYVAGVASVRSYPTFLVANLGAFAVTLGPAVAVGLARLRDRRAWLLVGGALAAVVIADVSGMSKGEVERIWLPFAPWVLVAGMAVGATVAQARRWLALQLATALAIEMVLVTAW